MDFANSHSAFCLIDRACTVTTYLAASCGSKFWHCVKKREALSCKFHLYPHNCFLSPMLFLPLVQLPCLVLSCFVQELIPIWDSMILIDDPLWCYKLPFGNLCNSQTSQFAQSMKFRLQITRDVDVSDWVAFNFLWSIPNSSSSSCLFVQCLGSLCSLNTLINPAKALLTHF